MAFSIFEHPLPVVGFSFSDIQEYIIQINEKHDFRGQNWALKESIVGSKLFKRNFIEDFKFLEPKDGITTINALVKADLNNTNYSVCLTINAENEVLQASCECPGGAPPSSCKHTFAVLIFIQEYCSKELHSAPTEKLQEWHRPVKKEKFSSEEETKETFWEDVRLPVRDSCKRKCCLCGIKNLNSSFVHFHRFPKDPELSNKWANICGLPYIIKASPAIRYCRYRVCSQHFSEMDYKYAGKKYLLPTAVPSMNENNLSIDLKKLKHTMSIDVKKLKETMSMKLLDSAVSSSNVAESSLFQDVSEDFSPVTSTPVKRKSTSCELTPKIKEIRSLSGSRTPNVTKV